MNYIIGYRRVYSIMHIESVVCTYNFAKSVHNIHSTVWCVCICVHVWFCYSLFTTHTCLHLLLQEIYMHNYVTFSSQFICIFLNQRITAWLILSNVDVCYVCCRDSNQITNCTHSFNNVYCVRVRAYVCVYVTCYLLLHRLTHRYYTQLVTCFTRCFCIHTHRVGK